jgi:hypothetical protein
LTSDRIFGVGGYASGIEGFLVAPSLMAAEVSQDNWFVDLSVFKFLMGQS